MNARCRLGVRCGPSSVFVASSERVEIKAFVRGFDQFSNLSGGSRSFCRQQDASSVPGKIAQLQAQYGLKEIIFVGDRGMITYAVTQKMSDAKLFANRSALFANDAESAMIACSLL